MFFEGVCAFLFDCIFADIAALGRDFLPLHKTHNGSTKYKMYYISCAQLIKEIT